MQLTFRNPFARSARPRVPEEKASRTGALIALFNQGRPRWTPRDYAALAREGYARNPVAYRCVRMIAEAAASVPLVLYEGSREHDEHPLLALLAKPNPRQSGADLIEQLAGHLLVSGNAYLERVAIAGEARELHALRPDRMKVVPGAEGWPEAYEYRVAGSAVRFAMNETPAPILHLTLFNPLDDHYGMPPLEAAQSALDVHNAASAWNKALLDNAARPSGALVYSAAGGNLSDEQFERLKTELEQHYQGPANAGRPLLLEGGLDWKSLSLSPKDMDFVAAKHIAAREIALAFGVPPMLLGIPGDNTYSNYAEANRALYRQTVLPLLSRIAVSLGQWLGESFAENLRLAPDLDEIPALSTEREAVWARIGVASFLTDDEKRAAAGYGPLPFSPATLPAPLAKFDPGQPRVPAGNSDGGQWTSTGAGDDSGAAEDEELLPEGAKPTNYRQPRLIRIPNGQLVRPDQAFRLAQAEANARNVIQQVQQYDPHWRPRPSLTSTTSNVESQINVVNSIAREARDRLDVFRTGIGGNFGPPLTPPSNVQTPYVPPRSFDPPAQIALYRAVHRQEDLFETDIWDSKPITIAVSEFNGEVIYGVNSRGPGFEPQDVANARDVRQTLVSKYPELLESLNSGWIPNDSFFHAETTILLRAARANGGTLAGKYVDIYVNNRVCESCNEVLPLLVRELGNPTVRFRDSNGRVMILRNGFWE